MATKVTSEASRPLPTQTQMDIINRTWVKLKDNDELGSSLFLRLVKRVLQFYYILII